MAKRGSRSVPDGNEPQRKMRREGGKRRGKDQQRNEALPDESPTPRQGMPDSKCPLVEEKIGGMTKRPGKSSEELSGRWQ